MAKGSLRQIQVNPLSTANGGNAKTLIELKPSKQDASGCVPIKSGRERWHIEMEMLKRFGLTGGNGKPIE